MTIEPRATEHEDVCQLASRMKFDSELATADRFRVLSDIKHADTQKDTDQ